MQERKIKFCNFIPEIIRFVCTDTSPSSVEDEYLNSIINKKWHHALDFMLKGYQNSSGTFQSDIACYTLNNAHDPHIFQDRLKGLNQFFNASVDEWRKTITGVPINSFEIAQKEDKSKTFIDYQVIVYFGEDGQALMNETEADFQTDLCSVIFENILSKQHNTQNCAICNA